MTICNLYLRPWKTRTHFCRHKCFPVCPCAQHLLRTGHKKCFWFCSETFCVRNKCLPVYAAQEGIMGNNVSATMCPRLPGPLQFYYIVNVFYNLFLDRTVWIIYVCITWTRKRFSSTCRSQQEVKITGNFTVLCVVMCMRYRFTFPVIPGSSLVTTSEPEIFEAMIALRLSLEVILRYPRSTLSNFIHILKDTTWEVGRILHWRTIMLGQIFYSII